ncbi:MAG: hypothetical protein FWH06_07270, partial [Oscillospiraceae bacterium]|nr:hypothetical protein [Oscillospiraceae bacterium]
MNTRAKRLIRPPAALPALAAGLCLAAALLLAALFAQPFRPSRDGIAPSRNGGAFGLLKTMLDLELGLFKPPPAVNAVKTLLALEPGLPVGAKRVTARGGGGAAVHPPAPALPGGRRPARAGAAPPPP